MEGAPTAVSMHYSARRGGAMPGVADSALGLNSGTLDQQELIQVFAAKGIAATANDVDDLIRASNGAAAGDDVSGMECSFDAFLAWMHSSSPLANEMRHALGGVLDATLDMDAMGMEERELWAKTTRGWVYPGSNLRQTVFILLEEAHSSRLAKAISLLLVLLISLSTATFVLEVSTP
jgi:hypothetical protein